MVDRVTVAVIWRRGVRKTRWGLGSEGEIGVAVVGCVEIIVC